MPRRRRLRQAVRAHLWSTRASSRRAQVAQHRTVSRRPGARGGRHSRGPRHLLFRRGCRRGLEDHRRRRHLAGAHRSARPISSVGALAIAPSDHNVIYVGTGEAAPRGDMTYGDGVYKSVDGGKTWSHIGLDGHPPDRRADRRSAQPGRRAGRRPRPRLRSQQGARRVPHDRRRQSPGPRCSIRTSRPARSTSASIRTTRQSSTQRCGRRGASRGTSRAADRAVGCIARPTAARPGRSCRATVCRPASSAASTSRSRRGFASASTR